MAAIEMEIRVIPESSNYDDICFRRDFPYCVEVYKPQLAAEEDGTRTPISSYSYSRKVRALRKYKELVGKYGESQVVIVKFGSEVSK